MTDEKLQRKIITNREQRIRRARKGYENFGMKINVLMASEPGSSQIKESNNKEESMD